MITIAEAHLIVNSLRNNFDSHDFIFEYIKQFPESYEAIRDKYEDFAKVHAEISNFLRHNSEELNILRNGNEVSTNISGNQSQCASWIRRI